MMSDEWEATEDSDEGYEAEVELDNGMTAWGIAAILVAGIGEVASAVNSACENVAVELAHRHNAEVDKGRFIGSVRAGLERL